MATCTTCWEPIRGWAVLLRCNHLVCESCVSTTTGPSSSSSSRSSSRGFLCSVCRDMSTEDEVFRFQSLNRSLSDSELGDLRSWIATGVLENGPRWLLEWTGKLADVEGKQRECKADLLERKNAEAVGMLEQSERARKDILEQSERRFKEMEAESEDLRLQLRKASEKSAALANTLKDRERQLENWKQTYARRNESGRSLLSKRPIDAASSSSTTSHSATSLHGRTTDDTYLKEANPSVIAHTPGLDPFVRDDTRRHSGRKVFSRGNSSQSSRPGSAQSQPSRARKLAEQRRFLAATPRDLFQRPPSRRGIHPTAFFSPGDSNFSAVKPMAFGGLQRHT